jgi:hypothetical protein
MLDLYKRAAGWRLYRFLPPSGYQVALYGLATANIDRRGCRRA